MIAGYRFCGGQSAGTLAGVLGILMSAVALQRTYPQASGRALGGDQQSLNLQESQQRGPIPRLGPSPRGPAHCSTAAARTDMLVRNVMHKVARPSADGRHAGVARASVQAQPARCPVTVGKVNSKCASVRCNVFVALQCVCGRDSTRVVALRCVCLVTPRLIFARRLDLSQV